MAPPPPRGAEEEDAGAALARRLHRELNARPARRGRTRPRDEAAQGAAVKEEEAEAEEVKIRAVEWWPVVKAEQVEEVKIRAVEWVGEGGKRRRVKREREEGGTAEAGPSGRGAGRPAGNSGRRGSSRFRGLSKVKGAKAKPWAAQITVTEDGKHRKFHIGRFAREEDAARAYDRVSIAKLGHAKAPTNFPAAEYQAAWAELEALGLEG